MEIMMPETDEFHNDELACAILGHEMAHILTGLNSPDNVLDRRRNEAVCDLVGVYLAKLAELIAGWKIEKETFGLSDY